MMVGDVYLHSGEKSETRDSHPASSIIRFLSTPGINKAYFGKELYPEVDPQYRMSMMDQFYHKLNGNGNRRFSQGELRRLETIIDLWVGDIIQKYEAIKTAVPANLH
jgi:hypothetical protein